MDKQRLTIHLDPAVAKELKRQALDSDMSMSEYVAVLVKNHSKKGKENAKS